MNVERKLLTIERAALIDQGTGEGRVELYRCT